MAEEDDWKPTLFELDFDKEHESKNFNKPLQEGRRQARWTDCNDP